jgi:hypothetical protein
MTSARVVTWNSHETVKCPVGAFAWHPRLGRGRVLASRGWTRLVEFRTVDFRDAGFGSFRIARRRCESIDVRELRERP